VPRQSRSRLSLLFVLVLLLVVIGGVSYLGWRRSVPGVRVVSAPPKFLGAKTSLPLVLEASRGTIGPIEVTLAQSGKTTLAAKSDGPHGQRADVPLAIEPATLGLHDGAATLEVRARDNFWRPLRLDVGPALSVPVTIKMTPPKLEILSSTQYLSPGGVGLVVFRVDGATRAPVSVGATVFPSFAYGPPERGARVAFIALPYDFTPGPALAIRAEDEAGNVTTRGIPAEFKPRRFPHDKIQVRDSFLEAKVPELLPQRPANQSLIDGFLVINRDQRKQAEAEKRKIGAQTAPEPLWDGPFVQPRNTKVFSNFAETRTYFYQGREVDTQVHYGYDLASTKQSPVPAANKGVVAFTGPLTIYGNTVVLDHGLGLQTLYAHLSSIEVKVGDKVDKGTELGRSGSTGLALGDHLHYEMLVSGISITPIEWWDAKWIRDHVNLPLHAAGLPEITGFDATSSSDDEAAKKPVRARRRR
jgi:murein DD-endopeptidase MepM/ murein hydrolase activator NlpD